MSSSLQQNVIDAVINEWRKQSACMQIDNSLNIYRELLMRLKKLSANKV